MYEAFYGFSEKPFSLLPDPSFLYLGKEHSHTFSMLEYGLRNQAGITVITGEIGSGKTTLIRYLLKQISDDICVGLLSNTQPDNGELLRWALLALDQDYGEPNKVSLYDAFSTFLIAQYAKNRRTILVIDEAQNLEPLVLEELRMLTNINIDKHQVLQLILVGQPQLRNTLQLPELIQFSQRVSVDYHLTALTESETVAYVHHRTRLAGCEREIFTQKALHLIFQACKGIPRIINVLCDTALVYGFADQEPSIGAAVIRSVIKDRSDKNLIKLEAMPAPQTVIERGPADKEKIKKLRSFDMEMAKQLFSKLSDS